MIWLILYIIGYIGSYYCGRHLFRNYNTNTDPYAWKHVILISIGSLFIVFLPITLLMAYIDKKSSKPPKWL